MNAGYQIFRDSILILFFGVIWHVGCSVEIDTKISIVNNNTYPTFQLSGTGELPKIMIGGPYENIDDSSPSTLIWEVDAIPSENNLPAWRIPPITYGIIPSGFVQKYPETGKPPALKEGKYYCVFVHVYSANSGNMCFTITNNKAIEVKR